MKIIFGLLLIAFIFLSLIAWLGYSSRNNPEAIPSHDQQAAETQKKEQSSLKSALKIGFVRLGEFIHDFREEIVAVGTLFIAVFTVILAFATGFLYFATKDLVKGAGETAERQLRAYVSVQTCEVENFGPDKVPHVILVIKNFGQTPAYELTGWIGFRRGNYPLDVKLEPADPSIPLTPSVVGPTDIMS